MTLQISYNTAENYELPPIALCPYVWMDAEKALKMGITLDGFKYSLGYISTNSEYSITYDNFSQARMDFFDFYKSRNFSSLLDYYGEIALDLPAVDSNDEFNKMSMGIKISDKNTSTVKKTFMDFEICYAYMAQTGRSLYTRANAIMKYQDKTSNILKIPPGLWVELITDWNFLHTNSPPLYIPPFTKSKILIRSERFETLNKSNAPCLENMPNWYSGFQCAIDCQNKQYSESIGCQLFRYSTMNDAGPPNEYCHYMENLKKRNYKFDQFRGTAENEKIGRDCIGQCLERCDRMIYEMNLQWQATIEPDEHSGNDSYKQSVFQLYFEHMATYEGGIVAVTEVSTYSLFQLIDNVGGTLGLFVGGTLMTFVQLVWFCCQYSFEKVLTGRSWACKTRTYSIA